MENILVFVINMAVNISTTVFVPKNFSNVLSYKPRFTVFFNYSNLSKLGVIENL